MLSVYFIMYFFELGKRNVKRGKKKKLSCNGCIPKKKTNVEQWVLQISLHPCEAVIDSTGQWSQLQIMEIYFSVMNCIKNRLRNRIDDQCMNDSLVKY